MTTRALAQDLESLLVEVSTGSEAARQDLLSLGPAIVPKLLDYAVGKQDFSTARMARYALTLFPEADFSFISTLIEDPRTEAYGIKCVKLLGRRAAPIESRVIARLKARAASEPDRLASAVGAMGIESAYRLYQALGVGFDSCVRQAILWPQDEHSVKVLVSSLKGDGPLPQWWASEAFEILAQSRLAHWLAPDDSDVDGDVASDAILLDERRRRGLVGVLEEPRVDLELRSPRALEDALEESAKDLLLACLENLACTYRPASALMLGLTAGRTDNHTVAALESVLDDKQELVRWRAAYALAAHRLSEGDAVQRALIDALLTGDVVHRRAAAKLLSGFDRVVPGLEAALRDPDRQTRWNAAPAFKEGYPADALPVLLEMLDQPGYYSESAELAAFGEAALPGIAAALASAKPHVKRNALEVLSKLPPSPGRQKLLPTVIALIGDPEVQNDAAECLSDLAGATLTASVDPLLMNLRVPNKTPVGRSSSR